MNILFFIDENPPEDRRLLIGSRNTDPKDQQEYKNDNENQRPLQVLYTGGPLVKRAINFILLGSLSSFTHLFLI
ncbi:hypothetical protein CRP01_39510 [Flavilitoribacter nigricans DSM 23189 = NBRC 102662]|uniref:Uncharacterized protein n=1 Tax=Flavilitoribacter nigricans (strain ATCC 23147 / DSM 23189 / NBRC 102662 / NCIMB 1420 / SS-2) TaxID=1122177 RepID=A0A2D0MXH4_FLAN2|nr:hypothetical protein CRP01_39510 [Flavilitoribacter nigricans DSM 23189 = NBRC 102662]